MNLHFQANLYSINFSLSLLTITSISVSYISNPVFHRITHYLYCSIKIMIIFVLKENNNNIDNKPALSINILKNSTFNGIKDIPWEKNYTSTRYYINSAKAMNEQRCKILISTISPTAHTCLSFVAGKTNGTSNFCLRDSLNIQRGLYVLLFSLSFQLIVSTSEWSGDVGVFGTSTFTLA